MSPASASTKYDSPYADVASRWKYLGAGAKMIYRTPVILIETENNEMRCSLSKVRTMYIDEIPLTNLQ